MFHIFCALPCEAEPIIQYFKLSALKQFDLFRIYQSKDKRISLTITGIGKINAAAAVCYHHACISTHSADCWLNIGVAGHRHIPAGESRLINKITDHQTGACWYPQILFEPVSRSIALITLDKPSEDYQESLFDMEASAFYQMAIRLGTAELIHSLKIISDNTIQPTSTVNAATVIKLMTAQIDIIEDLMKALQPFADELAIVVAEPEYYQTIIEHWHFTQSERIQLSRLLRQWTLRCPAKDIMQTIIKLKTAKQVIQSLQEEIKHSDFVIHD